MGPGGPEERGRAGAGSAPAGRPADVSYALAMTGPKSPMAWIEWAWQELDAPDAGRRDSCLEVVGDVLETGLLAQGDAVRVVERLVAVALSGESYGLRESALHAVCTATTPYELPYLVVAPLAAADGMEPSCWSTSWASSVPRATGRRSRPSSDSCATPIRGCAGRRRTR